MSKLNITQRRFIINQIKEELAKDLNDKYKNKMPSLFGEKSLRFSAKEEWRSKELYISMIHSGIFNKDTCASLRQSADDFADKAELPKSWYKSEFDAGRVTCELEMEDCMHRPRALVEFTNEDKALKRLKTKIRKDFEKAYKEGADVISEARYDFMEAKKYIKDVVVPKCMLTDDGVKLMDELKKAKPDFK